MKRIKINRQLCISCLTCVTACQVAHDGEDPRNRVVISSHMINSPIFCRHCDKPECAITCMTGAMYKDPKTGYVLYDGDHCASCYMCVMGCPFGVLKPDRLTQKMIMKCDMCIHHPTGEPQCVARCPMAAITLEEVETPYEKEAKQWTTSL